MMNLQDTYYHIQFSGIDRDNWCIGDKISINKNRYNSFYSNLTDGLNEIVPLNEEKMRLIEYSNSIFKKELNKNVIVDYNNPDKTILDFQNISYQYESLADKLHKSLFHYLKWFREESFENIRMQLNSDLPSRKNCIWLTKKDTIKYWWNLFNNKPNRSILLLRLIEGKLHKVDGGLLLTDTYGINAYKEMAKKYWDGTIENIDKIEYLFEGKFEVINNFFKLEEIEN